MFTEYINKKLKTAKYKILKGVWAPAKNLEDCRKELQEVLEDWFLLKVRDDEKIPGFEIKIRRRELVNRA